MEIRKMEIRRLREEELAQGLKLIWEVFEKEIGPSYTEEGVQEFLKFINYDSMKEVYDKGDMIFWGAFTDELIGTVAVRPDGHISLFFVKNEYQGLGIGKALFQMMYNYCVEELHVKKITVNATPQAVAKYIHMGMRQIGNMEERKGIRSVPMEMYASPTLVKSVRFQEKKSRNKLWIVLSIIIVLLIGGAAFAGMHIYKNIYNFVMEEEHVYEVPEDENIEDEELTGLDAVESYEAENISYKIENDAYNYLDTEKINTVIDFSVQYPVLSLEKDSDISEDVIQKVNKTIYECAMKTVDEIYLNPTDEIKDTVLNAQEPVLVSYVTYKVTYAGDEFICVCMEDQGYRGNEQEYYYDFRTLNISLNDGTVYDLKDIIRTSVTFRQEWLPSMRYEVKNELLLRELSEEEIRNVFKGETFGGVYEVVYFVHANGIQIGFAFDYEPGDENDLGYSWVTVPYSISQIKRFQTSSTFWDEIN